MVIARLAYSVCDLSERARDPAAPLLTVSGLTVEYERPDGGRLRVLDGADLSLAPGEALGVMGESGAGKSTLALAIAGLLPAAGRHVGGTVCFRGRELTAASEHELGRLRGDEIALLPQRPGIALSPLRRVQAQVAEVVAAHRPWSGRRCRQRARAVLTRVGLDDEQMAAFPHQLSGGQLQRVALAQALACRPALLIADEPTAALDTVTQAEIGALLDELRRELGAAILLIAHNPATLGRLCDRVLVLYAGRPVEEGPCRRVFARPFHPYTRALLAAAPRAGAPDAPTAGRPLPTIPGEPADPAAPAPGCAFEPRCSERLDRCRLRRPQPVAPRSERRVRCFLYGG